MGHRGCAFGGILAALLHGVVAVAGDQHEDMTAGKLVRATRESSGESQADNLSTMIAVQPVCQLQGTTEANESIPKTGCVQGKSRIAHTASENPERDVLLGAFNLVADSFAI